MVHRVAMALVLAGCATAPAPVITAPEGARYPPAAETWSAPADDAPAPPLSKREACPRCDEIREQIVDNERAYEVAGVRREEYAKAHCKGVVTYTTRVFPGGARVSAGPERAWLCDGKLVEVLETSDEQILASRIGYLHHWVKENCESQRPYAVGEKRCVSP